MTEVFSARGDGQRHNSLDRPKHVRSLLNNFKITIQTVSLSEYVNFQTFVNPVPVPSECSTAVSVKIRRDHRGTPIIKGSKQHSVCFCDSKVSCTPLVEVFEVQSMKKFNKVDVVDTCCVIT